MSRLYEVTQTYWSSEEPADCEYYASVEVEADSPEEAKEKACLEGMFDDLYEVSIDELCIGDVYDVVEITE